MGMGQHIATIPITEEEEDEEDGRGTATGGEREPGAQSRGGARKREGEQDTIGKGTNTTDTAGQMQTDKGASEPDDTARGATAGRMGERGGAIRQTESHTANAVHPDGRRGNDRGRGRR